MTLPAFSFHGLQFLEMPFQRTMTSICFLHAIKQRDKGELADVRVQLTHVVALCF